MKDISFMDECFMARMDYLRGRFSLKDFKRHLKEQYAQHGIAQIQHSINQDQKDVMNADAQYGFIFNNEHARDIALQLIRRWGFSITKRREYDDTREYLAYLVQLPDDYIIRHAGSIKAGLIRTGLRRLQNVDMTKYKRR